MPSKPQASMGSDDDIQITGHSAARRPRLPLPTSSAARAPPESIVISDDDEIGAPPPKRQKTTTSAAGPSNANLKRKHPGGEPHTNQPCPYIRIDLTAYDDFVEDIVVRPLTKKRKPIPLVPKNETRDNPILIIDSEDEMKEPEPDSDSDYENIHDGYDIGWSRSAVQPDEHIFELDVDVIGDAVARLHLDRVDPHIVHNSRKLTPLWPLEATHSNGDMKFQYRGPNSFRHSLGPRLCGPVRASYRGGRSRTGMLEHRPPQLQSPLYHLKLFSRFQMADGCQSITQSSKKILVASSTPGGTMEDEDDSVDRVDPYNSKNTLALWTEDTREHWLEAHYTLSSRRKNYDIKCAQFDPKNFTIFVSTGRDGSLAVWKYMKPTINKFQRLNTSSSAAILQEDVPRHYVPVKQWGQETYNGCCHDIIYRPRGHPADPAIFAAPCDNGKVFLHKYSNECNSFSPVVPLQVSPYGTHKAGATVWGQGPFTSNMLFVCSEADYAFHGAFDAETKQLIYHFDQHASGEEIALNPEGKALALFTADERLQLHLYDVAHKDKRHTASVILPPPHQQLPADTIPEVGAVSWSPDGILLAVGCNDDMVHVYDVRSLGRGPVLSLTHETRSSSLGLPLLSLPEEERTESKNSYGITTLSWTSETCFKSPRMGLLTGGGDHCIALWDIKTACEDRRVIAELDGHVGVAHFGDLSKGEKPLVAGDTDGHIYIYDFTDRQ